MKLVVGIIAAQSPVHNDCRWIDECFFPVTAIRLHSPSAFLRCGDHIPKGKVGTEIGHISVISSFTGFSVIRRFVFEEQWRVLWITLQGIFKRMQINKPTWLFSNHDA